MNTNYQVRKALVAFRCKVCGVECAGAGFISSVGRWDKVCAVDETNRSVVTRYVGKLILQPATGNRLSR